MRYPPALNVVQVINYVEYYRKAIAGVVQPMAVLHNVGKRLERDCER